MRPTLGILVTYYGERELLTEGLESLLAGTDHPDEIIIHDDASDAPAQEYVPQGLNARVIRSGANGGPARARNMLLRESRSDYVHFHDADDWFKPEWCNRVRRALEAIQPMPDAVFTEVASVLDGQEFSTRVLGLSRLSRDQDLTRFCLGGSMLVPSGTYRREAVNAIGGYREALWQAEDFDFHVRLAASGISYAAIDEPLVAIRLRPESRSQRQIEVWSCVVQAVIVLADELPPTFRTDLADAAARAGSTLFRLGAIQEARRAFELAEKLGPPTLVNQSTAYRWVARLFTPLAAERVSAMYRNWLPLSIRSRLLRV